MIERGQDITDQLLRLVDRQWRALEDIKKNLIFLHPLG